ncbi:MAG TPA: YbjN domain-containing protein [Verrucomicrobiae bacterium]|nr:YbjN domain-containing protein [Verrucomicrobiae bacterium]
MLFEEAIQRYDAALGGLGYATEVGSEDGTCEIGFVRAGETFYLEVREEEPDLARFTLSYALDDAVKRDRSRLAELAAGNTSACLGASTVIDEDGDVEFRHDAFLPADGKLGPVLERILDALESAQQRFFSKLAGPTTV